MVSRRQLLHHAAELVGPGLVRVVDARDGWPGLTEIHLGSERVPVALHVGPIGASHRGRDDVERRFQNPGSERPVWAPTGYTPVLLGIWEAGDRPVFVAMDAQHRLGKTTRQSLFIPLWLLDETRRSGWAEHVSTTGERLIGFHPALLPTYLETVRQAAPVPPASMVSVVDAAGLNDELVETPAERARRAASQLVRSAMFGREVIDAYGGLCAMCGLDFGLVQGAHVYPAHAPHSPDVVTNGVALCGNHHSAFDRHLIWVDPLSRTIRLRPELHTQRNLSAACAQFVDSTFARLAEPKQPQHRPAAEMFARRYDLFGELYSWAA